MVFITPTPEVDLSFLAGTNTARLADEINSTIKSLRLPPAGLFLGIPDVDKKFGRLLEPGCLHICAARPSMGKTVLGVQVAEYHASKGLNVLVWSLEMSRKQLIIRLISKHSGITVKKMKNNEIENDEWPMITEAANSVTMATKTLLVNDLSCVQVSQINDESKLIHQNLLKDTGKGLDLIVVDYVQLVDGTETDNQNRQLEIASVSNGLRCLAKDLHIPIFALAQLNRDLEKRADKRPNMGDLRESGKIEQDATVISFLYREAVYCEDCKDPRAVCTKSHEHAAELLISKNRDGETGGVELYFDGAKQLFAGVDPGDKAHTDRMAKEETERKAKAVEKAKAAEGEKVKTTSSSDKVKPAKKSRNLYELKPKPDAFSSLDYFMEGA